MVKFIDFIVSFDWFHSVIWLISSGFMIENQYFNISNVAEMLY